MRLTNVSNGVDDLVWSPGNAHETFTARVGQRLAPSRVLVAGDTYLASPSHGPT